MAVSGSKLYIGCCCMCICGRISAMLWELIMNHLGRIRSKGHWKAKPITTGGFSRERTTSTVPGSCTHSCSHAPSNARGACYGPYLNSFSFEGFITESSKPRRHRHLPHSTSGIWGVEMETKQRGLQTRQGVRNNPEVDYVA